MSPRRDTADKKLFFSRELSWLDFDLRVLDEAARRESPVLERLKFVAADGATRYYRVFVDAMDDETFAKWLDYHFAICERQDLIGASHHTLDILRKL